MTGRYRRAARPGVLVALVVLTAAALLGGASWQGPAWAGASTPAAGGPALVHAAESLPQVKGTATWAGRGRHVLGSLWERAALTAAEAGTGKPSRTGQIIALLLVLVATAVAIWWMVTKDRRKGDK